MAASLLLWANSPAATAQSAAAKPREGKRVELGVVPLVGGDTDVGVGVGILSTVAGIAPDVTPYRWAVETAGFISFKREGDRFIIPYQDYSVQWTAPQLWHKRLRIEVRPSYTKETTQRFYGVGNASPAPAADVPERDFYGRTHPTLWVRVRYRIWDHLHAGVGASYTQNWLDIDPQSTLGQQMTGGPPPVRELLAVSSRHGVLLTEGVLLYDTRDSETVPEHGQAHQIRVRISPAIAGDAMPYRYQQVNLSSRFYYSVFPDRLVLAARVVTDMQFDHPPFYELARYDDTFALGGLNGVRGVPGQRYYGKIKVLSNFEIRSQLVQFKLFKKDLTLGAVLFFDAGRSWAEWSRHPELDGTGWGIKYGTGGGLRLQQGKTFVVRADIAWSPDARPIGGYVGAGQIF
ncbi:MAG: BamA/TamA family outer membrane protein [Haliangium ochraceum]